MKGLRIEYDEFGILCERNGKRHSRELSISTFVKSWLLSCRKHGADREP